jgi:hypothetical protein
MHNKRSLPRGPARPAPKPSSIARCGLALCLCAGLWRDLVAPARAEPQIYRCTAPDGTIEFRQRACDPRHRATEVQIEDSRTGWIPPPGEPPAPAERKRRAPKKKAPDARDPYADRCWRKRQQLERVNNELRAGYKPPRGVKLRRRRAEYEAFLRRYCR